MYDKQLENSTGIQEMNGRNPKYLKNKQKKNSIAFKIQYGVLVKRRKCQCFGIEDNMSASC